MTPELATIIAAVAGVVLVIAAAVAWWMNRAPHIARTSTGILPLFGADVDESGHQRVADGEGGAVPSGVERAPSPSPSWTRPQEPPGGAGSAREGRPTPTTEPVNPAIRTFTTAGQPAVPQDVDRFAAPVKPPEPQAPADAPVVGHGVPGTMVEGHLLRFSVPAEGTLQFLPGRLEIAAGMDSGREIRFVQVPGPNGTEVTFGRSEGELYRHVQLRDQTVSRSHARMRLDDGQWYLLNLSNTNPVVHNGRVLSDGEEQPLADGDRIEMGEVLFTFRSR